LQAPIGRKTLDDLLDVVPRMRQAASELALTFHAEDTAHHT